MSARTPPLVVKGTCGITVLGDVGLCFPSTQLAEEATKLANACTNLNLMTSGSHIITYSPTSTRNDTVIYFSTPQ